MELRKAIFSLKKTSINSMDSKEICERLFMYEDVLLVDAKLVMSGLLFILNFKPFFFGSKHAPNIDWKQSSRLMPGSLLIITNHSLDPVVYATVLEKPDNQDEYNRTGKLTITIKIIEG
jgi:hypothetical protein